MGRVYGLWFVVCSSLTAILKSLGVVDHSLYFKVVYRQFFRRDLRIAVHKSFDWHNTNVFSLLL